jgi:hypothetical protein
MLRGEGNVEEWQLSCAVCHRDFELPRRYIRRPGDFDFSPFPRLLPCLHTLCHSCLTEQYEKDNHHIQCAICNHREIIKSVYHLPFDISTLKQIVDANASQLMSVCARCYDDVSSVSWCETCSSALCEFHHQDHKLSVDTNKHSVATFNEYLHQNRHVAFHFPPLPCPECPMHDCTLYCRSCLHLVSAKGFLEYHKEHSVQDIPDIIAEMTQAVQDSIAQSTTYSDKLRLKVDELRHTLYKLDKHEEDSLSVLTKTFNVLHSKLKKREKELTEKITTGMKLQRKRLVDQLSTFQDLREECESVIHVGKALIRDTLDRENDRMYLVSASDSVEFRSDSLSDQIDGLFQSLPEIDPSCRIDFIEEDLLTLQGLVQRLGGVEIEENIKASNRSVDGMKKALNKDDEMNDEHEADDENDISSEDIYFIVHVDDDQPPTIDKKLKEFSRTANSHNDYTIVIEARMRKADLFVTSKGEEDTNVRDTLVGRIVLEDRIDSRVMDRCRMKR